MSDIEQLLRDDVTRVTASVVVTESDLREAREGVREATALDAARRRQRNLLVAAVAAVAVPVGAWAAVHAWDSADTSPPPAHQGDEDPVVQGDDFLVGAAPTPELLDGVWRVDNGTLLVLFRSDGTVQYDDRGALYGDPKGVGTYRVSGSDLTIRIESGAGGCAGARLGMRGAVTPSGQVHLVTTRPAREGCAPGDGDAWVLEQVLPTRDEGLAAVAIGGNGWRANTSDLALVGDWFATVQDPSWPANGGGYVLELAADGTYSVGSRSEVDDRGTWQFDATTSQLTMTSGSDSPTCQEGDRWVLGDLLHRSREYTALRGAVRANDCGADWTNHTWVQLPRSD